MIEAMATIGAIDASGTLPYEGASGVNPTGFANFFAQQMDKVNTDLTVAESSLQKLAVGEPIELHDVMIALETARIGVQTMVQVRNRMVEAYQDLMRMQI